MAECLNIDENRARVSLETLADSGIIEAGGNGRGRLLRNEALYQMALSRGYVASESEIEDLIQEMKDYYHSDDAIGIDVVTAYIAGTGMTPDAYFENQYDIYKKDFTIGHYLEDVKAD